MDSQQPPYIYPPSESRRWPKVLAGVIAVFLLMVGTGAAVFTWQTDKASRQERALRTQIADLGEQLAKARKGDQPTAPAEVTKPFVVAELGIQFVLKDGLEGLSYTYDKETKSVSFTSSALMTALKNVPNQKGQSWQPGMLAVTAKEAKTALDKKTCSVAALCSKEAVQATLDDMYVLAAGPQKTPADEAGFEQYQKIFKAQYQLLLASLKDIKAVES